MIKKMLLFLFAVNFLAIMFVFLTLSRPDILINFINNTKTMIDPVASNSLTLILIVGITGVTIVAFVFLKLAAKK